VAVTGPGQRAGRLGRGSPAPILVLRALGLGDALTAIPALRGLRRAFPGHDLVLAAPGAVGQWLSELGLVDRVVETSGVQPLQLPSDLTRPGQDLVAVNLHGQGPQSHRLLLATGAQRLIAFRNREVGGDGPLWSPDEHEVDR
jgi:hypothetical protein